MRVYLDNAATTPMAPEVVDAMCDVLRNHSLETHLLRMPMAVPQKP